MEDKALIQLGKLCAITDAFRWNDVKSIRQRNQGQQFALQLRPAAIECLSDRYRMAEYRHIPHEVKQRIRSPIATSPGGAALTVEFEAGNVPAGTGKVEEA